MHHQRDGLHLDGRGGLIASCPDVLNDPGVQLVFPLKLFERAEGVRDVGAVHVDPVLMPDLIELKRSDKKQARVSNTEVQLTRSPTRNRSQSSSTLTA